MPRMTSSIDCSKAELATARNKKMRSRQPCVNMIPTLETDFNKQSTL